MKHYVDAAAKAAGDEAAAATRRVISNASPAAPAAAAAGAPAVISLPNGEGQSKQKGRRQLSNGATAVAATAAARETPNTNVTNANSNANSNAAAATPTTDLFRDSTASHSSNTSNYLRNSWLQYFMRQQSCERRLKELGYDAQGRLLATPVPLLHVPVKECQWILSGGFMKDPVVFNPVVTFLSVSTLWTIVIWCAVAPSALTTLETWRQYVSLTTTWIFQGTKMLFIIFMAYITFRYGHVQFGTTPDGEPEFSTLSYCCMIFAAGVSVGMLLFHVSEPLSHQTGHYFANAGYRSQDEVDMFAINMAVTNWGVTGWITFLVVAVCMSLAGHVYALPMTFRSCFFPILGPYTWGWMGDCIDSLAIIVTITGICTTLGLCAVHIVVGLQYLGWVDAHSTVSHITSVETATIWIMTFMATASAISGLRGGIRLLSLFALALSTLMLLLVTVLDDAKFLLNLQVQELGYYIQYTTLQLHTWTDAFGQLREGSGRAVDGKAADETWMDYWMIYTQASVNTWAAFVGAFVALISRGRRLWELVLYGFALPVVYCLVWFTTWGGIALRQSRQGLELQRLGEVHYNDSAHFRVNGSDFCYNVPQQDVVVNGETIFTNHLLGVTPVCQYDGDNWNKAAFRVLDAYSFPESFDGNGLGPTLSVLMIVAAAVYYVSSSDSACLIVDSWASNGRPNYHWARRMFWTLTVGAQATALLSIGGESAMTAVKAASIICGLPITVSLCYLLQSILLFCQQSDDPKRHVSNESPLDAQQQLQEQQPILEYAFPDQPEFRMPVYGGILNIMEYITSAGRVHPARIALGIDRPSMPQLTEFTKGLLIPHVSLYQVLVKLYPQNCAATHVVVATAYMVCYYILLVLWMMQRQRYRYGLSGLIWMLLGMTGVILATVRTGFRRRYNNVRSNLVADYITSIFLWPQVLTQMRMHQMEHELPAPPPKATPTRRSPSGSSQGAASKPVLSVISNMDKNEDDTLIVTNRCLAVRSQTVNEASRSVTTCPSQKVTPDTARLHVRPNPENLEPIAGKNSTDSVN